MRNKFYFSFTLFLLTSFNVLFAKELNRADSLFENKKYTEAYQIYNNIYQNGSASEAMLVKMAFIQEGLGNYVNAIIFLTEYTKLTSDRKAFEKIREIAEDEELSGYEYSDSDFFISNLLRYELEVLLLLGSLTLLSLALIIRNKKTNKPYIPAFVILILCIALTAIINNGLFSSQKGIILTDNTILMSGPSAGAEPVDFIQKGHKVELIGESSIWYKILWEGEETYVKKNKIKFI